MGVREWTEKYPPPFKKSNKTHCNKCTEETINVPNFSKNEGEGCYSFVNDTQLDIYIPYNIQTKNTKLGMCMEAAIPIKYCPWCGRKLKKERRI